jgi:starvation-inducible outer membrane lipoprotein
MMQKRLLVVAALLAFVVAGCKDKPKETPSAAVPQGTVASPQQQPETMPGQTSPHATAMPPAAASHTGQVVDTMNAAGYTYLQVEENGQKIWAAARQTKLKKGDTVEFSEMSVMQNFTSRTLNRTFDKIYFVSTLRVNGK